MKKKIMIDMDDVLTDGTFRKQIEEFIGHKIDNEKTGYYLQNALEDKKEAFFHKSKLDMYQDAPLKEGAYEIVFALNEKYDVYIVSSFTIPDAPFQEGNHLGFKIKYLKERLPFLKTEQFIFLNHKELIHFDIAIDDSVKNLQNADLKLLFDAYHNRTILERDLQAKGIQRVMNWKEVGDLLL